MVKDLHFILILIIPFFLNAQDESKSSEQFLVEIDNKIPQLLADFSIPGAFVAILEEGEIVLQKGYGFAARQLINACLFSMQENNYNIEPFHEKTNCVDSA